MSIRVVLVDDHPMMRAGLRVALKAEPTLEVVGEAATGQASVEVVRETKPDIVLMDVSLPDEEGTETARRLMSEFPLLKVLMVSAFSDADFVNRSIAAGASGYVVKSSGAHELVRAINTVMSGHTYLSPEIASAVVAAYRELLAVPTPKSTPALSKREREVLTLIAEGLKARDIAARLNIGAKTVDTYRARLMAKLHCSSTVELVRYAIREGITSV
jgi:two-component system, NarL family, response regulator NreC